MFSFFTISRVKKRTLSVLNLQRHYYLARMSPNVNKNESYAHAVTSITNWINKESILDLQPQTGSFLLNQPSFKEAKKGLIVCFHGYTSGPWQYQPLATFLFNQGFSVFSPRLPGHGFTTSKHIPHSDPSTIFLSFLSDIFSLITPLNIPIYVIGLSAGGSLASRMAIQYPSIKKCIILSPFFRPYDKKALFIFFIINFLTHVTKLKVASLLRHVTIYITADRSSGDDVLPDSHSLALSQIHALTLFGEETLSLSPHLSQPTLLITSDCDTRSNQQSITKFSKEIQTRYRWIRYTKQQSVPHALLHKGQNPHKNIVSHIEKSILDFLSTDSHLDASRP